MSRTNNFTLVFKVYDVNWPFFWGPFKRTLSFKFHTNTADVLVYQAGGGGEPITLDCATFSDKCSTVVDFKGGSRLKRVIPLQP
jgi:hypothetical protein